MKQRLLPCLLLVLLAAPAAVAQERIDQEAVARIRQEAMENSRVMEHLFYLTDVYGPRLAGSPNYVKAATWARDTLQSWGLENARLDNWGNFGRGWLLKDFTLDLVEPSFHPLIGFPKAWVGSTDGTVVAETIVFNPRTQAEMEAFRGQLRGKIALIMPERPVDPRFQAEARRFTDAELRQMAGRDGDSIYPLPPAPGVEADGQQLALQARLDFLQAEGAAAALEPSQRGGDGTVRVGAGGSQNPETEPGFPAIVLTPEHYNRLHRLTARGIPVQVRVNVQTEFVTEDLDDYNVIAELPGTDPALREEIVMIGAHLDSWHSGTGATDNASGSAVMMEVMRVLKTLNLPLRRTVRIGLWGSEERGHSGSRSYVSRNFATRDRGTFHPDYEKFSAYFNLDNGTGRIRGVYAEQNEGAVPILQAWLQPFHDLGAATITPSGTTGTDHQSFDYVGLPGFQFIQDPVAYGPRTHHTNMDVFDAVVEDDLKQAATIIASFVYHAANRDEKLPRKPRPGGDG